MKPFIPFFVATITCFLSVAQIDTNGLDQRLRQHLLFLADDSMKGRSTGTPEERKAGQYFLQQTKTHKKSTVYTWRFPVTKKDSSVVKTTMYGRFIQNNAPYTLLIGAHIDHIGFGDQLSLSFGKSAIHNGADDNASGVALLIELCRSLEPESLPFNLLFVPFTAHEVGTFGSEYLAHHLPKKAGTIIAMLNMDMMGRMQSTDRKLYVSCTDSLIKNSENAYCKLVVSDTKRVLQLDSKHFAARGIPSATFTTGMHTDYHKISDDEQYIYYEGMKAAFLFISGWIIENAAQQLPSTQ